MHRQIEDWSTWGLQKLLWLAVFQDYLRFVQLNIARLDWHNNTPFQKQYMKLRGSPWSEQKATFLISRLLEQDHYKFVSGMTAVELLFPLMKTQFFRSSQAIVSFGIKLAEKNLQKILTSFGLQLCWIKYFQPREGCWLCEEQFKISLRCHRFIAMMFDLVC